MVSWAISLSTEIFMTIPVVSFTWPLLGKICCHCEKID